MKKIVIISAVFIISFSFKDIDAGMFSKNKIGTTSAQFLKLGIGARPVAMGEAFAGLADDINAVYWNPAGLYRIEGIEVSAMHALWLEEMSFSWVAYTQDALGGKIAAAVNYLSAGTIEKYDKNDIKLDESYTAYDMAAIISYAGLIKGVQAGVNLKYITSRIEDESASGIAADIGVLKTISLNRNIIAGLVVQNLGTGLKFMSVKSSLPLNIKAGVSCKLNKLILALDVNLPADNAINANYGMEYSYWIGDSLCLKPRLGYKTAPINDLDAMSGFSAGFGFAYNKLEIDYAWVPYWELGSTHRLSAIFKFGKADDLAGKPKKQAKKKRKKVRKKKEPSVLPVKKLRIAVADLDGKNVSAMEASTVSDFLRGELINSGVFVVIERDNMEKILAEQAFQQTGCTDAECAVRIGKLLNVENIIVGSFSKLMGVYYINVRLVDVEKGVATLSETTKSKSGEDLFEAVKELAQRIIDRLNR